ncbi:MAG: alpha/beta hydrolase [Rhodospirillales bacterium]|nr:alpha/beta hydrolase [Acetobacter sp.]
MKTMFLAPDANSPAAGSSPAADSPSNGAVKSIVLVHGAWVDGSGWLDVYTILRRNGHEVAVVQNPLTSLADDVAATKRAIAEAAGPVILVGHSYGGVVVTEAGTESKVAGLVYIAAFAPDAGESVQSLIANPPPGTTPPPILPPKDGFLTLDRAKFPEAFAADVRPELAAFMAASQLPWGLGAFSGAVTNPAWRVKPSRYLVANDDRMIPPVAQRFMAGRAGAQVEEAGGSHAIYVSKPRVVAALIERAAEAVG